MFCAPSPRLKSRLLLCAKLLCICLPRRLHRDPSGKGQGPNRAKRSQSPKRRDPSGKGRGPNRANPESEVDARKGGTPLVYAELYVLAAGGIHRPGQPLGVRRNPRGSALCLHHNLRVAIGHLHRVGFAVKAPRLYARGRERPVAFGRHYQGLSALLRALGIPTCNQRPRGGPVVGVHLDKNPIVSGLAVDSDAVVSNRGNLLFWEQPLLPLWRKNPTAR